MNLSHLLLPPPFLWYDDMNYSSPYCSALHSHPGWQLTLSLKGTFFFICGDEKIFIAPGEWILLSPELPHRAGSEHSETRAIQLFFRQFPATLLPEFAGRFNFLQKFHLKGSCQREKCMDIADGFTRIANAKTSVPASLKNLSVMKFIMNTLEDAMDSTPPTPAIPLKIQKVLEYMEKHFSEPIGLSDFAAFLELSPSRFSVLFRQTTGTSPMNYFNGLRLCHAQTLLLSGETIKDTAARSGFSSASYFCRKFKNSTHKTPEEFVAACSEKNL